MPDDRLLQYVLVPHPDDELSGWSLVQRSPELYMVFVLLTRGEATTFADGHGLQADLGERVPRPQPFAGPGTATVKAQRLDAWHAFLNGAARLDPALDVPAPVRSPSYDFDLFVGDRTARVVFDLGDGRLTADAVTFALQEVRDVRRRAFPVWREGGAVGSAYWNRDHAGSHLYTHADHRAVHEALWHTDQGLPGPQWGRTSRFDPDAGAALDGRTAAIDADLYSRFMRVRPLPADPRVNPRSRRTGLFQHCYAWLQEDYWPAGEHDDVGVFSRSQTFWARFGPGAGG